MRRPAHVRAPSTGKWQAQRRPESSTVSVGDSARQRGCAKRQRGANAQPAAGHAGFGGRPGIGASAAPGASMRGTAPIRPTVYGCRGRARTSSTGPPLDDAPRVHHRELVAQAGGDAEVVGDQHHRHAPLAPQIVKQAKDLQLHRDVERGGRLVRDQDLGPTRDRDGDDHPLAHATGELVRIYAQHRHRLGDADRAEQLGGRRAARRRVGAGLRPERLKQLETDGAHRIEGAQRVLEDDRDVPPADRAHRLGAEPGELEVPEADDARVHAAAPGRQQSGDGKSGRRLPRARLADQP